MATSNPVKEIKIPEEGFWIYPGDFYLGATIEYTRTEGFAPFLEGRSSVGRLGLSVHATAGFGDDGFAGHWTLEIFTVKPIKIYAGIEICQIAYTTLLGERQPYAGKYANQGARPKESGLWRDFLR